MSPTKLSRNKILQTALGVVYTEGWRELSMRRLAQELDVWPMAIYRHFEDKDALLAAVAAAAAERARLPVRSDDPRAALTALLAEARRLLGSDDGGTAAVRPLADPDGGRLAQAGLRTLQDAGLAPERAAIAWRALVAYAIGSRALGGADEEQRFRTGLDEFLDGAGVQAGAVTAPAMR
jgi:TetR/AcrR family tetracycline transcriptional repressor